MRRPSPRRVADFPELSGFDLQNFSMFGQQSGLLMPLSTIS